jgi:cytochrome c oxidase subunit 4
MKAHNASLGPVYGTFCALIFLLLVTAGAASLPPGWWSTPVALAVAVAKASLIFAFFMRLRSQVTLVRVFALVGLFFLAILLTLTSADYLTRLLPA